MEQGVWAPDADPGHAKEFPPYWKRGADSPHSTRPTPAVPANSGIDIYFDLVWLVVQHTIINDIASRCASFVGALLISANIVLNILSLFHWWHHQFNVHSCLQTTREMLETLLGDYGTYCSEGRRWRAHRIMADEVLFDAKHADHQLGVVCTCWARKGRT